MDKEIFISKEKLRSAIYTTHQKAGFFTTLFVWLGLIITLLWAIPLVVAWMYSNFMYSFLLDRYSHIKENFNE